MQGQLAGHIDVAQVVLYVFWLFFAGLVLYLRREDKREGYPLVADGLGRIENADGAGFPPIPPRKRYRLYEGGEAFAPRLLHVEPNYHAVRAAPFSGAPLDPVGNPMLAGIGPGSYALRDNVPDLTWTGEIKIAPLRFNSEFRLYGGTPNPIGWTVMGVDRVAAGRVVDVWIDEGEEAVQFLETELADGRIVLVPMTFAQLRRRRHVVQVKAITAAQFADIPPVANERFITRLEEERIVAYFGGGLLFALPSRQGPVL